MVEDAEVESTEEVMEVIEVDKDADADELSLAVLVSLPELEAVEA